MPLRPAAAGPAGPAGLVLLVLAAMPTLAADPPFDALGVLEARRAAVRALPPPESAVARVARARELLDLGFLDEAQALLDDSTRSVGGAVDGLAVACRLHVAGSRFAEAAALRPALEARAAGSPDAARTLGRLLLALEDLGALDAWGNADAIDASVRRVLEADLAFRTNRYAEAEALYRSALEVGAPPQVPRLGMAACALRDGRTDEAADLVRTTLVEDGPGAAALVAWVDVLIRAGRASEASPILARVAQLWPWDERAHYQLGNGYAPLSYSDLERDAPAAFPSAPGYRQAVAAGKRALDAAEVQRLAAAWPRACEPAAILASLAWNEGHLDDAERHARHALALEPRYGRAHAILAKVLESRLARVSVRRDQDERRFAATPVPPVPGLESFVTNWSALTPRHQARVALSVAPWAAFVPVLVEGGQTYTIKLLHERLSETPRHEALADERITYDSRLWDDVRGCGGNDTVTGIEDVERTIFRGYDTVLHELTHQVHGVLTEAEQARIERAYAAATRREAEGTETFLSRYQSSSVWEYFAEGVHAACTEPAGPWDTRDMRRDRLEALDPDLLALARSFLAVRDVTPHRAPALVSLAWTEVERHRLDAARLALDAAAAIAPLDETVLSASVTVRLYEGEAARARDEALAALRQRPGSRSVALAAASAEVHATGDRAAARALLEAARPQVDEALRKDVDVAIAWLHFEQGELESAARIHRELLAAHDDDEDALAGLLAALALSAGRDGAPTPPDLERELRDVLTRCVRKRAGSRQVRASAAIALARLGDFEGARAQVREGLLNASDSDEVLAAAAYAEWRAGRREEASALATRAADLAPEDDGTYDDVAALVGALAGARCDRCRAQVARLASHAGQPPRHVWVEREHGFRSVHRLGPLERELLDLWRRASAGGAAR